MTDKWWHALGEGDNVNVIILQFDLGSHTKAAEGMATDVQAFREFKEFGQTLEAELAPQGFACLHWLGDGGLFARQYKNYKDAESVCAAADAAFGVFHQKWNATDTPLTLRITATLLHGVFIGKEAGYWYSLRLNQFLKHERQIGRAGAFVITNELLRNMDNTSDIYARFKDCKPRQILISEGVSFAAVTDRNHSPKVEPEADRFEVWLTKRTWPPGVHQVHANWDGTVVGDSLILGSALGKRGYDNSELIPVEPGPGSQVFPARYLERFDQKYEEIKHLTGKKACVRTYMPSMSDDATLRIQWEMIDFARARAFHEVIETDLEVWNYFSPEGGAAEPRPFPGILATHNVLILAPRPGTRYLLLAHRKKSARPGGYYNNRWSVSFEEQFFPVESIRDGRRFAADPSLPSAVLRGAKEELLGEKFNGSCSVSLHAVQVETLNLNLGVLGAVLLPGVDFPDLDKMWKHPDTIDRNEHDAILALPLQADILNRCLGADGLPQELWTVHAKAGREDLTAEDHMWHPTSKVRLALSLWLLECGLI